MLSAPSFHFLSCWAAQCSFLTFPCSCFPAPMPSSHLLSLSPQFTMLKTNKQNKFPLPLPDFQASQKKSENDSEWNRQKAWGIHGQVFRPGLHLLERRADISTTTCPDPLQEQWWKEPQYTRKQKSPTGSQGAWCAQCVDFFNFSNAPVSKYWTSCTNINVQLLLKNWKTCAQIPAWQ